MVRKTNTLKMSIPNQPPFQIFQWPAACDFNYFICVDASTYIGSELLLWRKRKHLIFVLHSFFYFFIFKRLSVCVCLCVSAYPRVRDRHISRSDTDRRERERKSERKSRTQRKGESQIQETVQNDRICTLSCTNYQSFCV